MRLATLDGRSVLVIAPAAGPDLPEEVDVADVSELSGGRFGPDPMRVLEEWSDVATWARDVAVTNTVRIPVDRLGAPVPWPRQSFAIGLNYREHATEVAMERPDQPMVFTKFSSALTGPVTEVALPSESVDWEVEMVAVIGRGGRDIPRSEALSALAGLMVGQDLSERVGQLSGSPAQFSLGKSHAGFAPTGPWLTTLDEIGDPAALSIGCTIDGASVQEGSTAQMIFPLDELVAYLSGIVELQPGDLIWTGTPAGVGMGRSPQRYLRAGEVLESRIEGLGALRQTFCDPN